MLLTSVSLWRHNQLRKLYREKPLRHVRKGFLFDRAERRVAEKHDYGILCRFFTHVPIKIVAAGYNHAMFLLSLYWL